MAPWTLGAAAALMAVLWLLSLKLRNASIIDAFWGPVFALILGVVAWRAGFGHWRAFLLAGMVGAWALRLGIHLGRRQFGHPEDARYAAFRRADGPTFWWRSFFKVFMLQAVLAWGLSLPLQAACVAIGPAAVTPWDAMGVLAWGLGLVLETIADSQLTRFRTRRGSTEEILDQGLWRYSRHPNYFGESLLWWGFGGVAAAATSAWWVWLAPAGMTYLLLRVSGVTLLEEGLIARKPAYGDYVARTSAFVPWPPRRSGT